MKRRYRKYRPSGFQCIIAECRLNKKELTEHNDFLSKTFPFGMIEGIKG